jgi:arylsulfatase A-like enzyme
MTGRFPCGRGPKRREEEPAGRKRPISFFFLFPFSFLLLAACLPAKAPSKPPIVFIVIDALRADHVGAYGYARPTTPNLDAFARGAAKFENAETAASWTVPSVASFFTGVWPWRHGVNTAESPGPTGIMGQPVLSDRFLTLAESLQQAGYATFGVSGNGHLDAKYGMAQGFERYECFSFFKRERVDRTLAAWLPELRKTYAGGKPYFLYVHYLDPHSPYFPIKPWIERWRPGLQEANIKQVTQTEFYRLVNDEFFFQNGDAMKLLVDLYDSEIAAADDSVGRLLRALPGLDNALVVITADHGEAFGEHHNLLHGTDVYGEVLRVPLLIRWPRTKTAAIVRAPVSLIDLYPTLATAAGAAKPDYLDGVDLAPLARGAAAPSRTLFAVTDRDPKLRWAAVFRDEWKWVFSLSHGGETLFRFPNDPLDADDRAPREPRQQAELRRLWLTRPTTEPLFPPGSTGKAIDPALRERLHSLGYL